MAYTEKVSLSGTALSFLLYECVNSVNSQEGFLIGDVTSEITNHISDSNSDNARLDTQIVVRTVLPLPSVSLFYMPTGRIKEDVLTELLSDNAREVVGWYKYRKNNSIKPTFRDKLISRGLQKYFEKHHNKKTFVTCNLSNRLSSAGSTHTFMYRFGKINCFDMYEYIEDVTANLGEKHTGYKKALRTSPHSIFNKIVKESNTHCEGDDTSDAILRIQHAVDVRLVREAQIAAKTECTVRQLEAEIRQMNDILADRQTMDLQKAYDKMIDEKFANRHLEMAQACIKSLSTPHAIDILNVPNILMNDKNILSESDCVDVDDSNTKERSHSPILSSTNNIRPSKHLVLNYAAALKNKGETISKKGDSPSTSKQSNFSEDLILFDVEENEVRKQKLKFVSDDIKCIGDSSPEY